MSSVFFSDAFEYDPLYVDDAELREFAESQGFEVEGDEGFAVSQGFAYVKVDDDEDQDEFLPSQGFQMAKTMTMMVKIRMNGLHQVKTLMRWPRVKISQNSYNWTTTMQLRWIIATCQVAIHVLSNLYTKWDMGSLIKKTQMLMQDAMDSNVKDLKAKGFGNVPDAAQYILPDQEEKMWTEGVFGRDTPRKRIYTLIFYLNKILGWRAENKARQCQIQDMVRKIDGNGTVYYEWAERLTKTRRGKKIFRPVTPRIYPNDLNPNRCVVSLLDEYLEKRRDNTEPSFFLSVKSNFERGDKGAKN